MASESDTDESYIDSETEAELYSMIFHYKHDEETSYEFEETKKQENEQAHEDWSVSFRDLPQYISRNPQSRYFFKICDICNGKHAQHSCPKLLKPKTCYICGDLEHGKNKKCPVKPCMKCFSFGHVATKCQERIWKWKCDRCHRKGHLIQHCPDKWRQYHCTTVATNTIRIPKKKKNPVISCYNCGQMGHLGHVVKYDRPRGPRKKTQSISHGGVVFNSSSHTGPSMITKGSLRNSQEKMERKRRLNTIADPETCSWQNSNHSSPPTKAVSSKECDSLSSDLLVASKSNISKRNLYRLEKRQKGLDNKNVAKNEHKGSNHMSKSDTQTICPSFPVKNNACSVTNKSKRRKRNENRRERRKKQRNTPVAEGERINSSETNVTKKKTNKKKRKQLRENFQSGTSFTMPSVMFD